MTRLLGAILPGGLRYIGYPPAKIRVARLRVLVERLDEQEEQDSPPALATAAGDEGRVDSREAGRPKLWMLAED